MKKEYRFYIYIVASHSGTLYTGFTNNLVRRMSEHKSGEFKGFASRYGCNKLVYYEYFKYVNDALAREKEIKDWKRIKKEELIKSINPHWKDLYDDLF